MKTTMEAWIKAFLIGLMFAISTFVLLESDFALAATTTVTQPSTTSQPDPEKVLGISQGLYRVPKEVDGKSNGQPDDDDDTTNGDSFCAQDSGYTVRWDNIVSKGPTLIIGASIPAYYGFNAGMIQEPQHAYDSAGCTYKHETKMTAQHLSYDDWSDCNTGVIRKHIEIKANGDRLYYSMKAWFVPKKNLGDSEEIEPTNASCILIKQSEAKKPAPDKS